MVAIANGLPQHKTLGKLQQLGEDQNRENAYPCCDQSSVIVFFCEGF